MSAPEIPVRRARTRPADLPELRLSLIESWNLLERSAATARVTGEYDVSVLDSHIDMRYRWDRLALEQASLWWVSGEMCELLYAMAPKIPGETIVDHLTIPSPFGLVVLEQPWVGLDSEEPGKPIVVEAFVWGTTNVYSTDGRQQLGERAASLSSYIYVPDMDFWSPLGRSDWPRGQRLDEPLLDESFPMPPDRERAYESSSIEDRRILAALFTLIATRAVTTTEERPAPRYVRRRAERAGLSEPGTVKVVTLRRPDHPTEEPADDGVPRRGYSHRFIVNPHTVLQPYGPKRALRKLIMRGPFVKGPADKPLVVKETVRSWIR